MTPDTVGADPALRPLIERPGRDVRPADGDVAACRLLFVAGGDAWRRVRVWRAAGVRCGVVLVHPAEPPEDRAALEPVVQVREATREALVAAEHRVAGGEPGTVVALPGGRADLVRHRFHPTSADPVELTGLEARLLAYLAARSGRVVGRDELQQQVWDHRKAVPTRAVDVAIARLRAKIEPGGARCLLTVRGSGYRLVTEPLLLASVPAASLVGREALLGAVTDALRPPGAAVALVGPPGVGKSALCRAIAASTGARVADLAGGGLDELSAVAAALRIHLPPSGDRVGALLQGLSGGTLILDHTRDDTLIALLAPALGAAGVRLVVASQIAPVVPGLTTLEVRPLPPAEAAVLLRRRAPQLDDATVQELVSGLDGLPLALELAAARAAHLGPEALRDPADRLRLLSPVPDDPARSLAASLARAWDRAWAEDRESLVRLTAFQGSFRLAWARAQLGPDAVQRLAGLAGRSLLSRDGERYRVLPVIATFVRSIAAPGADPRLPWLAEHAGALLARLGRTEARAAWDELADLLPDLCAQLPRARPAEVGPLATAIDVVLLATGTESERERWLSVAATVAAPDRGARAQVAYLQAAVQVNRSPREAAARLAALEPHPDPTRRGLHVLLEVYARTVVEGPGPSRALLAQVHPAEVDERTRWRVRAADAVLREQLGELAPDVTAGFLEASARALLDRGWLHDGVYVGIDAVHRLQAGDRVRAAALLGELVALAPALHDPRLVGQLHLTTGQQHVLDGLSEPALAAFDRAALAFRTADPVRLHQVDSLRAGALLAGGRHAEARVCADRVLGWARSVGHRRAACEVLVRLAEIEIDAGTPERAVPHASAARASAEGLPVKERDAAELTLAAAWCAAGRTAEARGSLERLDAARLTPWDRLQTAVIAWALGGSEEGVRGALDAVDGPVARCARLALLGEDPGAAALRSPSADLRRLGHVLRGPPAA